MLMHSHRHSCLFVALALLATGCSKQNASAPAAGAPGGGMPPIPVTTATAASENVPLEVNIVGTIDASSRVEVKSQVAGQIMKVSFTEGQDVKLGELLFQIDQRPYQDAVTQAEAAVERDRSQIAQAQAAQQKDAASAAQADADAKRFVSLADQKLISEQQRLQYTTAADAAKAAIRSDEAAVSVAQANLKADQATVERAKLDLTYCDITAPVSGRTGNLLVHAGNLVKVNDVALVVINGLDPVFVNFNAPEQYTNVVQSKGAGRALPVEVTSRDGENHHATAQLSVVDNTVDSQTGTIHLKATLANPQRVWWPGQFVDTRLVLDAKRAATVVPTEAVQNGQAGTFIYVVKADKSVEARKVTVSRTLDRKAIIENGISAGETVVTDGQMMLAPGAHVMNVPPAQGEGEGATPPAGGGGR
ncbi:MAG TPA: efflux RND transporter periplasmic adaptor subunit [Bryobacteraceae bacterium]|jgi:multidrug efflux system membrane fusion protein